MLEGVWYQVLEWEWLPSCVLILCGLENLTLTNQISVLDSCTLKYTRTVCMASNLLLIASLVY